MNKSEIAERAALILLGGDRDKKIFVYGGLPEWCGNVHGWADLKDVAAIVERAIAESQAPQPTGCNRKTCKLSGDKIPALIEDGCS